MAGRNRRNLFFLLKGQSAVPQRSGVARRHEQGARFLRRQRRKLLEDGGVDTFAAEGRDLRADAAMKEEHAVNPRHRRTLPDPSAVVPFRTVGLPQFDHAEG
jgi:hypothetical protein